MWGRFQPDIHVTPGKYGALMKFKPDFNPQLKENHRDLWFLARNGKILAVRNGDEFSLPQTNQIEEFRDNLIHQDYFGLLGDTPCRCAELPEAATIPEGMAFKDLRELFLSFDPVRIIASGCAVQLIRWNRIHRYCGQCGQLLQDKKDERAKFCPACDLIAYPRLSPAIIVAVIKDKKILLARSAQFPLPFFSVLAGFVEPGETLEACVAREVYEEVGIVVKNIRYFSSQPWPFPDSLMIGFTAEYAEGDIRPDPAEIEEADWFSADNLPMIPPRVSIARHLIDWFVENYSDCRTAYNTNTVPIRK